MVNKSSLKFILGKDIDPKIKKALQAIYGDLRDRKRFTFAQFRKTSTIDLTYDNPEFRKLSRRWYYLLNNTLVELGVIKKKEKTIYYEKNFNSLEEWAHTFSQKLVNNAQDIEKEGIVKAIKEKEVEKTNHMLEVEKKFQQPINSLLANLYVKKNLSTYKIAHKFGVSSTTVSEWLKKYNIKTGKTSQAKKPSPEELKELYVNQRKSTSQLAEKFGVSVSTAYRWLKEEGIKTRDRSEAQLQGNEKPTPKELKELYLEKNLTISEIAKKLQFPQSTIHKWLKEYGVERD